MDKQNVVYTCNRMLFSLEKEGNSAACYNMDELSGLMLSEIANHRKTDTVDSTYMRYLE